MDGVLLVDKPAGWTSHDAVNYIRRALGVKRVGHTGTLDPDATGLLIVLVGKATRLARFFDDDEKEYLATMMLGTETDTQDASGNVIEECPVPEPGLAEMEEVLRRMTGEQLQTPPMYSAVKIGGRPLYKLARKGEEVAREPRRVFIRELELVSFDPPEVTFRAICSKGTYIRTLCSDMGRMLGGCSHMKSLRRSAAGGYNIEGAVDISDKPAGDILAGRIIPLREMLRTMPSVVLTDAAASRIKDGRQPVPEDIVSISGSVQGGDPIKVTDGTGSLLAVGESGPDDSVRLTVVLV